MQLRAVQPKPGRLGGILLGKSYIENLFVSPSCGGKDTANLFGKFSSFFLKFNILLIVGHYKDGCSYHLREVDIAYNIKSFSI